MIFGQTGTAKFTGFLNRFSLAEATQGPNNAFCSLFHVGELIGNFSKLAVSAHFLDQSFSSTSRRSVKA
jgi:hypothetical protein